MSRPDSVGLFWEDEEKPQRTAAGPRSAPVRSMPPIPDTGWRTPTEFPNLSSATVLSIDCETFDPELIEHGPGWARGKGHLVGVSVGAKGGGRWYFPMRHEVQPEDNMDPEKVLAWLRDVLSDENQPKVGANILYDVGWLAHEGVEVKGALIDVQYAEALLDERASVALETMAQKYLGEGKESPLLYRWCADFYGGNATGAQRANMYRTPPRLAGPYAESDADLPLRLAVVLYPLLVQEGLMEVFQMECDLIGLLLAMRQAGVSVDISKAEQLRETLHAKELEEAAHLKHLVGFDVDVNAADSLARMFDQLGLSYGLTAKSKKPSFTKQFLENAHHPAASAVREIRKLAKLRSTFVESYILESHVNGKIYGQFHPMRSDDTGTRSGRYSSSTPNLQNIPSRDEILAPMVRGQFVPDDGHVQWRKYDYSQIEYRFLAHFAVGPLSDHVRQMYVDNPDTDYHEMTRELVHAQTGNLLDRKPIKTINFGLIYGMGVPLLSSQLGLTSAKGKELFGAYHRGAPFAKATMDKAAEEALQTGIITTIMGRRSRFDMWEPLQWDENTVLLPYDQAIYAHGNIRRAFTHRALNRRLQGSAADMMKKAMWRCWKEGIFDQTGVPRLTVHDELDFSDPGGRDAAFVEMKHVLENAMPLRVPVRADLEVGPDWGHTA